MAPLNAPTDLVTVVIPARNEESDIGAAIDSVLAQDVPAAQLEVIVVDGDSIDDTASVASARLRDAGLHRWAVVTNPTATTPSNLNRALAEATGTYVCRVDARSRLPHDYVSTCRRLLAMRPEVAVVGGSQRAVPNGTSREARGIARALNNRYGMGGSRYRAGAGSGPADTVYLGFFRAAQLRSVGGWDERLLSNQDFGLNRVLAEHGLVWFESGLTVDYVGRSRVVQIASQYHRFGRWKVRYVRLTGDPLRPRQLALAAVPVIAGLIGATVAVRSRRPGLCVGAGLAGLVAIDHAGVSRGDDLGTRLVGATTTAVIGAAWTSGVWREVFARA